MNPYFKPPPPIGSRLRNELWKLHKFDPATNTVRALSARFSIGLDRVLAILRLKALEEEMTAEVSSSDPSPGDRVDARKGWKWEEGLFFIEDENTANFSISLEDLCMVYNLPYRAEMKRARQTEAGKE